MAWGSGPLWAVGAGSSARAHAGVARPCAAGACPPPSGAAGACNARHHCSSWRRGGGCCRTICQP
eukprot:12274116-Alexandrium_andersonii.AAC.1